jgi:hypothetical protein
MPVPQTGNFKVYPKTIISITNNFSVSNFNMVNPASNLDTIDGTGTDVLDYLKNPSVGSVIPHIARTIAFIVSNYWDCMTSTTYRVASPGEHKLDLSVDTSAIVFNPGTVDEQVVDILSGDFPSGFLATNLRVHVVGTATAVQNPTEAPTSSSYFTNTDNSLISIELLWNGFSFYALTVPSYTGAATPFTYSQASPSDEIVGTGVYLTAANSFKNIGIAFEMAANGTLNHGTCPDPPQDFVNAWFRLSEIYLTGDYISGSWSANVTVNPTSSESVQPGDIITLTDPEGNLDEIDDCDSDGNSPFSITFIDVNGDTQTLIIPCEAIIFRSQYEIRFRLIFIPGSYPPYGGTPMILNASVTSTEFTGSVALITLNQLLADGSGVYKLTRNKRHDTYYDRTDPENVTEIDLKIPNPFIKTGYF